MQDDRRPGPAGRADGDPSHVVLADIAADLEAADVPVEAYGGVGVVVGQERVMKGQVHAGDANGPARQVPLLDS